jgi:hypothetical protein
MDGGDLAITGDEVPIPVKAHALATVRLLLANAAGVPADK